jgi:predicted glycoside hydrolase/deacetylase ChbG (UPF0249 family)
MLNASSNSCAGGSSKQLIINADDFGLSPETNRGIIQCREHGVLTSASLMVRGPAAQAAAEYAAGDSGFSVGLHVELGEWELQADQWVQTNYVVRLDDPAAVRDELARQLDAFRKLMGRNPTHLDSHQHVHQQKAIKVLMRELAGPMGIVLRGDCSAVRFCGDFYGQDEQLRPMPEYVSTANLCKLLRRLEPGITELSCHPGLDYQLSSSYRDQRPLEVQTLCDPMVRREIGELDIALISFSPAMSVDG